MSFLYDFIGDVHFRYYTDINYIWCSFCAILSLDSIKRLPFFIVESFYRLC